MSPREKQSKALPENEFFLPDFCQIQSLFLVLLIGELLAVIFTLLNFEPKMSLWRLLGLYSLSIQIISLISVGFLCLLRAVLARFSDWISGGISLLIILVTTFVFSLLVIRGYWNEAIEVTQIYQAHFIIRNLFIAGLIGAVALRYFYLLQRYRQHLVIESSAKLAALQARIRPHFLFNSMNIIASLTRIDPAKAEAAIEDLSDLFRATLETRDELIPFAEEMKNAERYLAIEQLRLGERLKVVKNIQTDTADILLPPLVVQPLLENAVYHGIQMLPEGGTVTINATCQNMGQTNALLNIEIINPKAVQQNQQGHGIALKNIQQRLEVIYAKRAQLKHEVSAHDYRVVMQIPVNRRAIS
ncbi:sensor histidine kinase [Aliikangiella maris]|uniref:Histidine kinase n=2 Tax=Aliikangiella maris TaxID=3162458 RepID=A0ABV3MN52_9GAMM